MSPAHDNVLLVFVKEPIAGTVKTRLTPPLSTAQARALYECFLEDGRSQCERIAAAIGADVWLFVSPASGMDFFQEWIRTRDPRGNWVLKAQIEGTLGDRLHAAFQEALAAGYRRAVVMGSDHPTLPDDYVRRAFSALERNAAVIGPSEDGGYYLLGLRDVRKEYFVDIPWSTEDVFQRSLAVLEQAHGAVEVLPVWYDVDDAQGLARLRRDLKLAGPHPVPRSTLDFLDTLAGVQPGGEGP